MKIINTLLIATFILNLLLFTVLFLRIDNVEHNMEYFTCNILDNTAGADGIRCAELSDET